MNITKEWLAEHEACPEGMEWFIGQKKREAIAVLQALIADGKLDWANWLIVRVLTRKQRIIYAIYATDQVRPMLSKDLWPGSAIESLIKVLKNNSIENRKYTDAYIYAFVSQVVLGVATFKKILNYGISLLRKKRGITMPLIESADEDMHECSDFLEYRDHHGNYRCEKCGRVTHSYEDALEEAADEKE